MAINKLYELWQEHNRLWENKKCDLFFIADTGIIVLKSKEFTTVASSIEEMIEVLEEAIASYYRPDSWEDIGWDA
jgi:hypothetical protein